MNEVEQLVIKNLLLDEEYVRKAMPFIKTEYFADTTGKKLFDILSKYFTDYSAIPTKEALVIEVGQIKDCLLYTSPSPRDVEESRMPSSA